MSTISSTETVDRWISEAEDAWESGELAQTANAAERALEVSPGNPFALHLLGLAAFASGDIDRAVDCLTRASTHLDAPAVIHRNLCEVCRQSGRSAEAEAAGRRAVQVDPDLAIAWDSLAGALFDLGKLDESRDCYAKALSIAPQMLTSANGLASTLYRLGDLEGARREAERVVDVDPSNAPAHCTLSMVLGALGDYNEALAHASKSIALDPRGIAAYLNAAAIEAQLGRFDRLLHWAERAYMVDPNDVHAVLMYASALRRVERFDEALTVCERAIEIAPQSTEAFDTLGLLLQDLGRGDEALGAFEKAEGLSHAPASILNDRAMLLMELGRKPQAREALDAAIALRPDFAMAWYNRADLKNFSIDDPDLASMEALLCREPALAYIDQIRLHFALGKAYMDAGDADRAFQHLAVGNGMKRRTFRYDADEQERFLQSIASTVTPSRLESLAGAGDPSTVPIFVIGMPRSGTSLIEQILASHPDVYGAGEKLFIERLLCAANLIGMTADGPKAASTISPEALPVIGREYVNCVRSQAGGRNRTVDKMPSNFLYAGYIHLMLPNAKIIHIRRNAADTCLSCYTKLFSGQQDFTYDLVELGRYYRGYERLTEHWRSTLPAESYLEIEYKSMVDGFEENVRRLLSFCGLAWDDACLHFWETKRLVKTASMTQVRSPIYKTSVGRWARYVDHLKPLLDVLREEPNIIDGLAF